MNATERIEVVEKSLQIFVCGLFSLIPVIGLIPGIYAMFAGARLFGRTRHDWNPAAAYLNWGMVLALATVAASFLIAGIIAINFA